MPALDTYHTIERFARNNSDLEALLAYRCLKHRTELAVKWQAFQYVPAIDLMKAINLYTGVVERTETPKSMGDMTEQERIELYAQACKAKGIQLDPSLLRKN